MKLERFPETRFVYRQEPEATKGSSGDAGGGKKEGKKRVYYFTNSAQR